ncbi:MAG TPA: hypothetical protein VGH97_05145 [Thermoanaerobaculia bacterium]|jgi:hypothetical protein
MKKVLAIALFLGVAVAAPAPQASAQQAAQKPAASGAQSTMPELKPTDVDMAKLQHALSTKRRELVAAAMGGLTPDQMQTFWAVYGDFEKERDANMSDRLALLKKYTDGYATLSDADIVKMANESAAIQKQTLDLRMKYFGILNQKLGAKAAGRFAHIDDYLSTLFRLSMLDGMPALQVGK